MMADVTAVLRVQGPSPASRPTSVAKGTHFDFRSSGPCRTVLEEIFTKGGKPEAIIEEKGLKTVQDIDLLDKILNEVFQENPDVMNQILNGDLKPVDFLIG